MSQQDAAAPAATSPKEHFWPVRVYYEDTDAAGVVYYANYLRFCERARTEWLRTLGVDQRQFMAQTGLVFVVSRVEADYLRPAELDDALEVRSTIKAQGHVRLIFTQDVYRGAQKLFAARVTIACIDWQRHRPARLPDFVHHFLGLPA